MLVFYSHFCTTGWVIFMRRAAWGGEMASITVPALGLSGRGQLIPSNKSSRSWLLVQLSRHDAGVFIQIRAAG